MKIISKIFLLSLIIANLSYSMNNTTENKTETNQTNEDEFFQTHIKLLSKPIADFIYDFKTWSKEEQDKITVGPNGFFIKGKLAAANKYNGNIGYFLDCRLTQQQRAPFLKLVDHIKQQNK